jgi:hypothetical protein
MNCTGSSFDTFALGTVVRSEKHRGGRWEAGRERGGGEEERSAECGSGDGNDFQCANEVFIIHKPNLPYIHTTIDSAHIRYTAPKRGRAVPPLKFDGQTVTSKLAMLCATKDDVGAPDRGCEQALQELDVAISRH